MRLGRLVRLRVARPIYGLSRGGPKSHLSTSQSFNKASHQIIIDFKLDLVDEGAGQLELVVVVRVAAGVRPTRPRQQTQANVDQGGDIGQTD